MTGMGFASLCTYYLASTESLFNVCVMLYSISLALFKVDKISGGKTYVGLSGIEKILPSCANYVDTTVKYFCSCTCKTQSVDDDAPKKVSIK